MNINLEDDAPLYPNETIQPASISCPCLPSTRADLSNEDNQALETIIARNDIDDFSSNNTGRIYLHYSLMSLILVFKILSNVYQMKMVWEWIYHRVSHHLK